MKHVRICVDIDENDYPAYQNEAARQGVTVEALVERIVREMIGELKRDQSEGTDHPIIPG